MSFMDRFRKSSTPPNGSLASGVQHYLFEKGTEKSRLHLRLDEDGHGTLIVNASRILHLNPSAAWMAHLFLEKITPVYAVHLITKRFRVAPNQARQDYESIQAQLEDLIRPDGDRKSVV